MKSTMLITGASGGFGLLMTETMLSAGHKVIASMRDASGRNKEKADHLSKAGAHIVELDVTDQASVDKAMATIKSQWGGMDTLVNNAGVGVLGYQESFTPEDWQKLFAINVFGVQRMIRAALPMLREKGHGSIINVSSLLGRMTIPFFGPYNASKWAVEAMTENYRTELSQQNIDVMMIEPGGFPTAFAHALMTPSDKTRDTNYSSMELNPKGFFGNFEQAMAGKPEQNPQLVADALKKIMETPRGSRKFRTVVDTMGMGDPIEPYNNALEQVTKGIYGAFGIDNMLTLKK